MKILPILFAAVFGVSSAVAQSSASVQTRSSAQAQTSASAGSSATKTSASGSGSASARANAGNHSAALSSGTKVDAVLMGSLDAKKNKPGDRVEARVTHDVKQGGKVVLKRGTHLVGHVTRAQARMKGQAQSQLGIAFDYAQLNKRPRIPVSFTIQAMAASQSAAVASMGSQDMMAGGAVMGGPSGAAAGGGLIGRVASTAGAATGSVINTASSVTGTAGGTLGAATRSVGAVGGLTSTGTLVSNSNGVFGLEGLSLTSAASDATQGSVIASSTRNVHLSSGTQMLLSAAGQTR
jgi:hypothetical protein